MLHCVLKGLFARNLSNRLYYLSNIVDPRDDICCGKWLGKNCKRRVTHELSNLTSNINVTQAVYFHFENKRKHKAELSGTQSLKAEV